MTSPVSKYDIYEDDLDSLLIEVAGNPHPHCIKGYGYGSKDCQQKYSKMNPNWKGAWYENLLNVQNGFEDAGSILIPLTDAAYADQLIDKRYRAVYSFADLAIRPDPGDHITLHPLDESAVMLQIQNIEINPNGKVALDLGKRKFDEIDAFNAKNSLADAYSADYLTESTNSSSSNGTLTMGDDDHGWCTPWTSSPGFTVPAAVADPTNNHRVTIDFSLKLNNYVAVGEATVYFTINGYQGSLSYLPHYKIGDSVSGIDITNWVNYGSPTPVVFYAKLNGEWQPAHANCSGHPTGTVNMTVHAWRRNTRV